MTFFRNLSLVLLTVCLGSATAGTAFGQTIAGDDFDGGATNGGFTATSHAVFEGDFDTATFEAHDNTFNGLFDFGSGSRFDRLGRINAAVMDGASFAGSEEGLPFDLVDDSLNGFAPDSYGILSGGVDNGAFGVADTLNGTNIDDTGLISASWTFDISSGSNMQMSIDFAAIGDFEIEESEFERIDFLTFTYSIDGGATQTAFDARVEADSNGADAGVLYSVTMDGGEDYDFYPSPFFNESNWEQLVATGPFSGNDFHPDDTDMDGFIDIEGAFGVVPVKAISSGDFLNTEFEAYKDPLIVNGDSSTGTILDNNLQTVTVPIVGSGETLTLKLLGRADGSLEYQVFDNILIEEVVSGVPEDLNGDGFVDGLDLGILLGNFNQSGIPASGGELNGTDPVDGLDLGILLGAWAPPALGAAAVPEPTSIGLVGLAMLLASAASSRRR